MLGIIDQSELTGWQETSAERTFIRKRLPPVIRARMRRTPSAKDLLMVTSAIAHDKLLVTLDADFEVFRRYGPKAELIER